MTDDRDARIAALEAELAERTRERDEAQRIAELMTKAHDRMVQAREHDEAELAVERERREAALRVVHEQARDEGLWFRAELITEDYLQVALRRLHAAIEG